MDYREWGREYLAEAAGLKKRVDGLRRANRGLRDEQAMLLSRRITMLYGMYLECLHTGRYLIEKGEAYEKRA